MVIANTFDVCAGNNALSRVSVQNLMGSDVVCRSSFIPIVSITYVFIRVETQIEHGILRHASTKPMLFGPLTVNLTFAGKLVLFLLYVWFL